MYKRQDYLPPFKDLELRLKSQTLSTVSYTHLDVYKRQLELIAAWLPDVEKFSKEISKQRAYIDSLKEQIGQERCV